jgi:autotransporter passenger strand-loop-strand repeat protein
LGVSGTEEVKSGGVSSSATIRTNGTQVVSDGGRSNGAIVLNFGVEKIDNGGTSFLSMVSGKEDVRNGGVAISSTVQNGGMMFIHAGGSVNGLTLVKGTVEDHGSLAGTMNFAGPGGNLKLFDLPAITASIAGFGAGDTIDLGSFGFSARSTAFFSNNTLTVTNGNHQASLTLLGPYSTSNFALSDDGAHGTLIKFA